MREIKFREWQHQEKKMYHIDLHNEALLSTNKHDVLMQWTGLRDKNDVEIYEGDIVNLGTELNFTVQYDLASFKLVHPIRKEMCILEIAYKNDDIEVIGNIYESSSLLETD